MLVAEAMGLARYDVELGNEKSRPTGFGNHQTDPQAHVSTELYRESCDPLLNRECLEKLADWCHRFSPTVGIEDSSSPETLLLDVTNLAPLFGGEEAFVEQVEQGIRRLRLNACIALADNIATAWAVTHYGLARFCKPCDIDTQSAIVPAKNGIPAGNGIPAEGGSFSLESLPVAALRLPDDVLQNLIRLGVDEIGTLLSLPRDQLLSRFGPLLLKRINQALGHESEVFRAVRSPVDFTVQWLLEHPLSKWTMVEEVIERLVRQVVLMLSDRNKGVLQLACWLECELAAPICFEAGLFRPSDDATHILEILALQAEKLFLPSPVNAVKVSVTRHAPLAWRQGFLFEQGRQWGSSSQLVSLVDRLAGRLGRQAVVRCRLQYDAQPELAYREDPLVGDSDGKKRVPSKRPPLAPLDRPLHFFMRPIQLEALAVAPGGIPSRFQMYGWQHDVVKHDVAKYDVAKYWGPERIETGWWREQGVCRDYYRVETTAGRRFWLFRCLRTRRWFLQGIFE